MKIVSEIHKRVMNSLEAKGIECMEEVPFPPYTVDIYVPAFHIAVEVDGPQHSEKKDTKRDNYLLWTYKLWIFRISDKDFNANALKFYTELVEFLDSAANSAIYRFEKVQDKIPWI